jgi:O-6-methylguanine DNA methyltransferase
MLKVCVKESGNTAFGAVYEGEEVYASNFGVTTEEILKSFQRMFPSGRLLCIDAEPTMFAQKAVSVVREIYEGKAPDEIVPLALGRFPAYTQRVLKAVSQIPVGYVASYGGVADAVGGGARAVGNAMATNCFAPLVPCHRVVTSSLGLGGYGGGLRVKFEFLKREKRGYTELLRVPVDGGILRVFPVEFVLRKLEKSVAWNRR